MSRTLCALGLVTAMVVGCADAKFGGSSQAPGQSSRSTKNSTSGSNGKGGDGNQGTGDNGNPTNGAATPDANVDGNASASALGNSAVTGDSTLTPGTGNDGGITTDDGKTTRPPDTVVGLTATVTYDGVVEFCVDFAAGKLIFATQQSRIDNPALRVDSQVQYASGQVVPSTATFNTPTPNQESPLPGKWDFVASANPVASNVIRLAGKGDAPVYHVSTTGTRACFDGDDSGHDQSGLVQVTMNYQLTPK